MDITKVEELIDVLKSSGAQELRVAKGDVSVCIRKRAVVHKPKPVKQPIVVGEKPQVEVQTVQHFVTAPMVGIYHVGSKLIEIGNQITAGTTVGSIESMKLLNDVVTEESGVVAEIFVEDGTPVQYGQNLFRIDPLGGEESA